MPMEHSTQEQQNRAHSLCVLQDRTYIRPEDKNPRKGLEFIRSMLANFKEMKFEKFKERGFGNPQI